MSPGVFAPAYAYGHLDVTTVLLAPPRDVVRAALPPALQPAAQTLTPAGTHPLMLMFGHHSHVRPWFRPPGAGASYHEWIVVFPFVVRASDRPSAPAWSYMARLDLDSLWYVLLGWIYGYPKLLSRIRTTRTTYDVASLGGRGVVSMTSERLGTPGPLSDIPGASSMAPAFDLPFIQQLGPLPWLASRMWFELSSATGQPARARFSVDAGAAPGLQALAADAGPIGVGLPGALHLSCDWMLSRPYLVSAFPPGLRDPLPTFPREATT
jgi:hypothetical protein